MWAWVPPVSWTTRSGVMDGIAVWGLGMPAKRVGMPAVSGAEAVIGAVMSMTYTSWDVELRAAGGVTPQDGRTLVGGAEAGSRRTQQ